MLFIKPANLTERSSFNICSQIWCSFDSCDINWWVIIL